MTEPDISQLKQLLRKQVTRKEFLQLVGLGVLSLVGVTKLLGNVAPTTKTSGGNIDYGVDEYGG